MHCHVTIGCHSYMHCYVRLILLCEEEIWKFSIACVDVDIMLNSLLPVLLEVLLVICEFIKNKLKPLA